MDVVTEQSPDSTTEVGARERGRGRRGRLLLALPVLMVWIVWGLLLDRPDVGQPHLFWAFASASVVGVVAGAGWFLRRRRGWRRAGTLALLLLVWRVGYFPILVFSGVVASAAEWSTSWADPGLGLIYSVFIASVCLFHAAVAVALCLATRGAAPLPVAHPLLERPLVKRALDPRVLLAVAIPQIGVALAVSVIEPSEDLTLLPDWPWHAAAVPAVHAPRENPYLSRVTEEGASVQERILAFNAGATYAIIPPSRWGNAIKGTLEHLCFSNPDGSSTDRVQEHYLAYLAAHDYVLRAEPPE